MALSHSHPVSDKDMKQVVSVRVDGHSAAGARSAGKELMFPSQVSTKCYDVHRKASVRPKRDRQKNLKCQAEQAAETTAITQQSSTSSLSLLLIHCSKQLPYRS